MGLLRSYYHLNHQSQAIHHRFEKPIAGVTPIDQDQIQPWALRNRGMILPPALTDAGRRAFKSGYLNDDLNMEWERPGI
ncbi:MAG: hypothetical protein KY448_06630 [Cyanobacteria bacterium 0813]|nr:hypothetical protein [Cyanobacteria bacterium 0813]